MFLALLALELAVLVGWPLVAAAAETTTENCLHRVLEVSMDEDQHVDTVP